MAHDKFKTEVLSALSDLATAVEKLEEVCEDLIDCNDQRLMDARHFLQATKTSLDEMKKLDG